MKLHIWPQQVLQLILSRKHLNLFRAAQVTDSTRNIKCYHNKSVFNEVQLKNKVILKMLLFNKIKRNT